jgi:hypothetical protein
MHQEFSSKPSRAGPTAGNRYTPDKCCVGKGGFFLFSARLTAVAPLCAGHPKTANAEPICARRCHWSFRTAKTVGVLRLTRPSLDFRRQPAIGTCIGLLQQAPLLAATASPLPRPKNLSASDLIFHAAIFSSRFSNESPAIFSNWFMLRQRRWSLGVLETSTPMTPSTSGPSAAKIESSTGNRSRGAPPFATSTTTLNNEAPHILHELSRKFR